MHAIYNYIPEFFTLLTLEMILGIDNLVFISIVCEQLPTNVRCKARICGLTIALAMRFLMLFGISYVLSMNSKIFSLLGMSFSRRDLLMISGGAFLIYKSVREIYSEIFPKNSPKVRTFSGIFWAISQIIGIDIMLSLDSIISAVGITDNISLIGIVFLIYALVSILISKDLGKVINRYSRLKVIALLFIGALGIVLVLDGMEIAVPHGYLYSTLLFSLIAEFINHLRKNSI
ncbi:MAG: TerC family protein [Aaplasma endosymbiont of Hyalomma asiaticum]